MASANIDSDSDAEFECFTENEVTRADIRALEKTFEVDDFDSDIDVSDVTDDETSSNCSATDSGRSQASGSDTDSEDDNIVLADLAGIRWSKNTRAVKLKPFTGPKPGPTSILAKDKNELHFLNLLFEESFYEDLAKETNLYAARAR